MKKDRGKKRIKRLLTLIIILLLFVSINLNWNLMIVNKDLHNQTNQRIQHLEQKLTVLDSRYANVFSYQHERIKEIANQPTPSVVYIDEVETHKVVETQPKQQPKEIHTVVNEALNPATWITTVLTGIKLTGEKVWTYVAN